MLGFFLRLVLLPIPIYQVIALRFQFLVSILFIQKIVCFVNYSHEQLLLLFGGTMYLNFSVELLLDHLNFLFC